MKKPRNLLIAIFLLCSGSILIALYLQIFKLVLPCPLCVLQRYALVFIACCCLVALFTKKIWLCSFLGGIVSLAGIYLAVYQLWVIAHPAVQCGRDALEDAVNSFFLADWIPVLFKAESLCSDILEPFLFLTPPQWALLWYLFFAFVFAHLIWKKGA